MLCPDPALCSSLGGATTCRRCQPAQQSNTSTHSQSPHTVAHVPPTANFRKASPSVSSASRSEASRAERAVTAARTSSSGGALQGGFMWGGSGQDKGRAGQAEEVCRAGRSQGSAAHGGHKATRRPKVSRSQLPSLFRWQVGGEQLLQQLVGQQGALQLPQQRGQRAQRAPQRGGHRVHHAQLGQHVHLI